MKTIFDEALLLDQVEVAIFKGTHTCLPSLETIELYSVTSSERGQPSFELGSPLAYQQGARGVCKEIGRLVSNGVLPSLKQVKLTKLLLKSFL